MLKIKPRKPTLWLAVFATLFALSWAVWTFFLVPASDTPSTPAPVKPVPQQTR